MIGHIRYAVNEILENGTRRTWWQNRIAHRIVGPIHSRWYQADFRVMDEDWRTLIVLDACRADLFEEVANIDSYDEYRRQYSAGSATNEWCRENFSGQAHTDTIYVTGNPVVSREVNTAFHQFLEVWPQEFDTNIGTVPPEPITEAALAASKANPDKRLIVHYLQPHYPFISRPDLRYSTFGQTDEITVDQLNTGAKDVWEAVGLGLIDYATAWEAYADNLQIVLEAIEPLVAQRRGRTVVTSDHGNMLGERLWPIPLQLYGHPPNIHHPALRNVPWAVVDGDRAGLNDESQPVDVEDQLRSLGYVE